MREIIQSAVSNAKSDPAISLLYPNRDLSDDFIFNHIILRYIFHVDYSDHADMVTDGSNDGGIDFVYYDEEESKVIVGQCKYRESFDYTSVVHELDTMWSTVENFLRGTTGQYNARLRKALQNALDRLPDEYATNVELHIFIANSIDISKLMQNTIKTS